MQIKRPIKVEGDVAYIPLTLGYVAVIDASDLHLVAEFNWTSHVRKASIYAVRTAYSPIKSRRIYLHRVLLGEPIGLDVDHIDGDGLNNRRSNLRLASRSENMCNARISRRNTSGRKGVTWDKSRAKWQAQIVFNGKKLFLGRFVNLEDASAACAAARANLHGAFGRAE